MHIDYLTDTITRLIQIINNSNNRANETERNIAVQMIQHLDKIPNCSLQQVADFCYCSISTISRFVKKLNFEDFSTFRYKLALDLFNSPKLNLKMPSEYQVEYSQLKSTYLGIIKSQIDELDKILHMKEIEHALELIHKADTILIYSLGDLDFQAFQIDMALQGKAPWHVKSSSEIEKALKTSSNLVVIAPLFSTRNGIQNVEFLHEQGVKMIIAARENISIYEKYADVFIKIKMSETKMDNYMIYLLLDIIAMHYRKKYTTW